MTIKPSLIIFVGGLGAGLAESMLAGAHRAITLDLVARVQGTKLFQRIIVVTDMPELERALEATAVTVERSNEPFHFGSKLREVIHKHQVESAFHVGGGSVPLLSAEELAGIARQLAASESIVIANNYFSADLVAFAPAAAIDRIELPPSDNDLARRLHQQAGLPVESLPRTPATLFDIDTPTDLMILGLHPGVGPNTRAYLDGLKLDDSLLRAATEFFPDRYAQIVVAGRAGSYLWAHLEKHTVCRVRFLSEERGLRADGREEQGGARSILGFYLEEVGPRRFFAALAQMGNAAFLDTRVLFSHLSLKLTAEDRFLSDLGLADEIADPFLKEFTKEARSAAIPVVLGGHSLVAGGLMALVDAYWLGQSAPSRAAQIIDKGSRLV